MTPKKRQRILEKIKCGRASRTERLILKQEGLCFYCHTDLDKDITKEHLEAKAIGGSNELVNLRAAHMLCNGIVGTLPVDLKLDLHETGRDHGPEAFWTKAREFQRQYGEDKNAYRRLGGNLEAARRKTLGNPHNRNEPPREVTEEDAQLELDKLQIGAPKAKIYRQQAVDEEVERRKQTGLPVQIGLSGWFRMLDSQGWAGVRGGAARRADAA